MTKQEKIDELLSRTVVEVIDQEHLLSRLRSGKKLRVKLGIDPTSPNIHIGRAVVLWKLRAFQDLGHQVLFMIGDFTGTIGDTSDKDSERPMLTDVQVKSNLKTYFSQAFKILDKSKTETSYNSTWLKKLRFGEVAQLADLFGLHEFEARENISKRLKAGKRVSLRELLYPLMQGYDSVALRSDVELGGTDQRFNLLAGRVIQKQHNQEPQDIITMELLEGTDGRKMSSSWGNVINITEPANEMFGKVMSIDDSLIKKYFVFATTIPVKEIDTLLSSIPHPRDQKLRLAEEITALYHDAKAALKAKEQFVSQFSNKELPSDIPQKKLKPGNYQLSKLLVETGMCVSNSEARRLITQRGVKVNQVAAEADMDVQIKKGQTVLLQIGKRNFLNIIS